MNDELVLITGAGRGIGRAIAEVFSAAGYRLALVSRSIGETQLLASTINGRGGDARAFVCDVADPVAVERLHKEVMEQVGAVSILINNAGIAPSAKLEATTNELWNMTMGTNVNGPFYLSRAFAPAMKAQGFGRILMIASTAALEGYAYTTAYVASKHAVLGLTRALAKELQRSSIAVNALCPGFVRTNIVETSMEAIMQRTGKSKLEAEQDLAKLNESGKLIEPIEVAALALEVVQWNEFKTGLAIKMDGSTA